MAKVLTNQIKDMLGLVASESQSAFVPNRLITDNILVVAEMRYYLKRRKLSGVGYATLKLDMSKAYDQVE